MLNILRANKILVDTIFSTFYSESGCQTMQAVHCRNESEGFTLVQRHFIGMLNRCTREKKYRRKSYPGLLPARIGLLLEVHVRRTSAVLAWFLQHRSTTTVGELHEVTGLTASSSHTRESVCTFGYKGLRLITLCRLICPLLEVRLITSRRYTV